METQQQEKTKPSTAHGYKMPQIMESVKQAPPSLVKAMSSLSALGRAVHASLKGAPGYTLMSPCHSIVADACAHLRYGVINAREPVRDKFSGLVCQNPYGNVAVSSVSPQTYANVYAAYVRKIKAMLKEAGAGPDVLPLPQSYHFGHAIKRNRHARNAAKIKKQNAKGIQLELLLEKKGTAQVELKTQQRRQQWQQKPQAQVKAKRIFDLAEKDIEFCHELLNELDKTPEFAEAALRTLHRVFGGGSARS